MLQRPWLTPFVVVFWCLTSGWLFVDKILPSLAPGSPPGYQALYASPGGMIPVAWTVHLNDRPLGWALAETRPAALGGLIVDNRLHFDRLPIDEIVPSWATLLVRKALTKGSSLTFDARGRLTIDAAGNLRSFTSAVSLPGSADTVTLQGTVDSGTVRVHVQAGELKYEKTAHLPEHLMMGDELSPQATMPGLYPGRRWTVPIYSPLRAGGSPIEILHAEVGPEETHYWEGHLVRVHLVEYREDPSSHREPRCRLWVDRSGRVLRQESAVLGSKLLFIRKSDDAAAQLHDSLAEEAAAPEPSPTGTGAAS